MHNVELVHVTPDAESLIAYMARVSNPSNQHNDNYTGLIKYLIKHKHWSPFEMVNMCVEIDTTRSIAAQILRHRSFSFQEFSQRYAQVVNTPQLPNLRRQDTKNRQNSIELGVEDIKLAAVWEAKQIEVFRKSREAYEWALQQDVAKEQARAVLPEGLTNTTLYMAGTLRSWIHYCQLRMSNGTQKEHQEIAEKCWEIIGVHFPAVVKGVEG
jgi:thymidylate synthase (FAD)